MEHQRDSGWRCGVWQPIETLNPKSITTYILWNGEEVFTGWRASNGRWSCDQYAEHMADDVRQPTHWMPLPDPPQ